jgi:hypothetical protein
MMWPRQRLRSIGLFTGGQTEDALPAAPVTLGQPIERRGVTEPIRGTANLFGSGSEKSPENKGGAKPRSSFDTFTMFLLCFAPDIARPRKVK